MRTTRILFLCLFIAVFAVQPLLAQAPTGPLWCMSFWKMKMGDNPRWRFLAEKGWMRDYEAFQKAGLVDDYAFLTHDYATEWNLITFARFKDYAGVEAFEKKSDDIARTISPDTVASGALGREMRSYMIEHFDSFVRPIAGTNLDFSGKPGENPLWLLSVYRLKLGHGEDLEKWLKANWMVADEEMKKDGTIKGYCYLMHDFGSEWNFIRVTKLTSYADMDKFQTRTREIAQKIYPDTEKRQQASRLFSDMVFAHFDAFMRQMGR
jgi:hypothetical protein